LQFILHGLLGLPVWAYFLTAALMIHVTIMSATLYLHRTATHRGLDMHPLVSHVMRAWLWLSTGMLTKEWVAVHRKHHAVCETAEDPHSPKFKGLKKVVLEGAELYREEARNPETLEKYGRGTPEDWVETRVYTRHGKMGVAIMLVVDVALFGIPGITIWAVQMMSIPFFAAGVVNGLGHYYGYRNFECKDAATNVSPWGVILGGEELHNNHHAFPSSAKFALRKWEFDIGWSIICALKSVGMAKVLRVAPTLDVRPNVHLPDAETLKAVLTHRFHAMTDYYRNVIVPTLRDEAQHAGDSIKAVPRRMRLALADGGRWLDSEGHDRLQAMLAKRPALSTVCEFRSRLAALMEQRGAEQALKGLQQWIGELQQAFAVRSQLLGTLDI